MFELTRTAVLALTFAAAGSSAQAAAAPSGPSPVVVAGDASSVPLQQEHGVLLLQARADGAGPMLFVLDPGGTDTYTHFLRDTLEGHAPRTLCVSQACFPARMSYLDGDPQQIAPSHDPAGGTIAGSIGLQMLRNYVITIDYQASTLTLTPPARFRAPRGARRFPLSFDAFGQPAIEASVDGRRGLFELDVRAGTSMLFSPFLDRTGLRRTYAETPVVRQSGTLAAHAVRSVQVGSVALADTPFWFSTESAGKFANPDAAGLLANNVLSHFRVTFDVPHRAVYLAAV
jgi:hypothetical protein